MNSVSQPREPDPTYDEPQARRSRRRWLWLAGALIILPVVGVLVFNAWAAAKLDRALEDLRARGEPVTVAELYALLEANAPEDEHNLAMVPALLAMQDSEAGRAARALLGTERPHHLDLLDKSDLDWGRASDTQAGSIMRTAEDFDQWHPDNPQMMQVGRALRTIALAALERDDPELALCSVELQLALLRSLSAGSGLIGGLVAVTGAAVSDAALYDGLRRQAWDEQQLMRLQSALELSFPSVEIQPFLQMARISGMSDIRWVMRERGRWAGDGLMLYPSLAERILLHVMPDGSFHIATVSLLEDFENEFVQPGAPLLVEVPEDHRQQRPEWLQWLDHLKPLQHFMPDASTYHRIAVRFRAAEARMRLAHAAVALERFHLRHGRWPDTWQEMIPAELAEVPRDPFTGGELRLLPVDEEAGRTRPVIYSLGLNCTDDGGTQAFREGGPDNLGDIHATGDVVWGYPAGED